MLIFFEFSIFSFFVMLGLCIAVSYSTSKCQWFVHMWCAIMSKKYHYFSIRAVRVNQRRTIVAEQLISIWVDAVSSVSHLRNYCVFFIFSAAILEWNLSFNFSFDIHIERKPEDSAESNATSVFNISGRCDNSAAIASTSTSSLEHTNMVEISIEDLPPPYDDAMVKKPQSNRV